MKQWMVILLGLLCALTSASGAVVIKKAAYTAGATDMEGYIVRDNADNSKRPCVIVAHEQGGRSAEARAHALQIARLGYVVLTMDLYGDQDVPTNTKDMFKAAGLDSADRRVARDRAAAALKFAKSIPNIDPKLIAAVGYGVGGSVLIELARTGTEDIQDVLAVGSPIAPRLASDKSPITAGLMLVWGDKDPFLPASVISDFEKELKESKTPYEFYPHKGVVHDFTNPRAGNNAASGSAFDTEADAKSWEQIKEYLVEALPLKETIKSQPKSAPVADVAKNVPQKVLDVLKYVDDNGEAMDNYEGGRSFGNFEGRLPLSSKNGKKIRYHEWDVNPLRPGVNRGAERLVTGSDGSAYYTSDHYQTFRKIR